MRAVLIVSSNFQQETTRESAKMSKYVYKQSISHILVLGTSKCACDVIRSNKKCNCKMSIITLKKIQCWIDSLFSKPKIWCPKLGALNKNMRCIKRFEYCSYTHTCINQWTLLSNLQNLIRSKNATFSWLLHLVRKSK